MSEIHEDDGWYDAEVEDTLKCPACKGSGMVHELTDPKYLPSDFFCAGATTCPTCDGTGEF